MIIQIDTREKVEHNKHITAYFDAHGVKWIRSKLYAGDYSRADTTAILIERKADILELAGNLGKGHLRFRNEILRANQIGAELYILIEQQLTRTDLEMWSDKRSRMTGQVLYAQMRTIKERYGVNWVFCHKDETAKKILEILEI
jgi:ERCC4-type nuclease